MMQTGLLDWQIRFKQLDDGGDPLHKIRTVVDWKLFRPLLEVACKVIISHFVRECNSSRSFSHIPDPEDPRNILKECDDRQPLTVLR